MEQFYGKYRGIVVDNRDPELRGRVRASVPDVLGDLASGWSLPCLPFAGKGAGFYAVPPIGAMIWIEFEGGHTDNPIWTGCCWPDTADVPPETLEPPVEGKVLVKTGGGLVMISSDAANAGGIAFQTAGGQKILLKDGPGSVEIQDTNGNSILLDERGITVTSSLKVTVNASIVELSAGMVTVDAGMSRFSGVVQADTVICNSVISNNYTPGAGNIL